MSKFISTVLVFVLLSGFAIAQQNVVVPYILRAPAPITVDGALDEWGFAFPIDLNKNSLPDSGRFTAENPGWLPEIDDCSGTIYMMYDDDYLYVAASVRDDDPGHFSDAVWAADGIEFYICNMPMGANELFPQVPATGAWPNDQVTGDYAIQLGIYFDVSEDSIRVYEYYGVNGNIASENTQVVYSIWPNEDGYNLEGKIYLPDLDSPTTGNSLSFTPGTRIPMTWDLYDIDGSESSADFQGLAFTPKGYAGWQGVGPGWQCCDVMETPRGFGWNDMADFDFTSPYIKKVAENRPVTVDGDLSDWNFCFPLDFWRTTIPDSGRFKAENPSWFPVSDEDLKGTLMMMYDENYLYVAAKVEDNDPGHFSDAVWAADGMEYYICNIPMAKDALHPEVPTPNAWPNDQVTGDYAIQLGIYFDVSEDSIRVYEYYGVNGNIASENTQVVYWIWPDENGYNLEGKIYLPDLDSPTTGNTLGFVEGTRIPMTWDLYDIDGSESSADFHGFAYTPKGYAGWQGVGPGWQYADVKDVSVVEYIDYAYTHGGFPPTAIGKQDNPVVSDFRLDQNYPNPFNPTTNISFSLDKAGRVSLKVYDLSGKLIKTVLNNQPQSAGVHQVKIDLSNMSSGVYFAVLNNGSQSLQRKMMLIK